MNSTITRRRCLHTAIIFGIGIIATAPSVLADAVKRRIFDLKIGKRKVDTKNKTIRLTVGEVISINWTTDETVELHLHGYDIKTALSPGKTITMTFQAHTAGRFPVTAHDFGHATLVYLEIYPK
ncbi:MAG: hypothetical protein HN478_02850 [Rhodospirillaceae bacterium]|jgi:hypothetical protein|nr:hypothetical protein [Rhodospirillaceae bacterium]MBT5191816.1 hypothetical protein [Rhodospirillaceae bacterium]MBT5896125.1 hypothetical protein [Rhodospirillaceae bacterium]MBT6429377.1 hypothetical protein [Rhodospirillaceae bacterium]